MSVANIVRHADAQNTACKQARKLEGTNAAKYQILLDCANAHSINEVCHMTGDFLGLMLFLSVEVAREHTALLATIADKDSLIAALEFNVEAKKELLNMSFGPIPVSSLRPQPISGFKVEDFSDEVVDAMFGRGSAN